MHAKIWLQRWKEGTQSHWTKDQERNNYIGMIGQKCFEATLQQLEIPYVPNDPLLDWRGKKNYDFRIPTVGTVEVKTTDFLANQIRVLVKCSEWHDSDYCFALKLINKTPTKVTFMGYATGKEVKQDFIQANNRWPCELEPCYWQLLSKLRSASEFFKMLQDKKEVT